jgi:hypothetical protein
MLQTIVNAWARREPPNTGSSGSGSAARKPVCFAGNGAMMGRSLARPTAAALQKACGAYANRYVFNLETSMYKQRASIA